MAFPAQTLTTTKVATGHLVLRINDNSVSTGAGAPVEIGRIIDITDVATGKTFYQHKGYNSDGTKQNVALFATEAGSGAYRVTLDEVKDIDGVTWDGEQVDVAIKQQFTKATTTAWRLKAAKAVIDIVSFKGNMDTPTTLVVEITPYNSTGTAAWDFDDAFSVA